MRHAADACLPQLGLYPGQCLLQRDGCYWLPKHPHTGIRSMGPHAAAGVPQPLWPQTAQAQIATLHA